MDKASLRFAILTLLLGACDFKDTEDLKKLPEIVKMYEDFIGEANPETVGDIVQLMN